MAPVDSIAYCHSTACRHAIFRKRRFFGSGSLSITIFGRTSSDLPKYRRRCNWPSVSFFWRKRARFECLLLTSYVWIRRRKHAVVLFFRRRTCTVHIFRSSIVRCNSFLSLSNWPFCEVLVIPLREENIIFLFLLSPLDTASSLHIFLSRFPALTGGIPRL